MKIRAQSVLYAVTLVIWGYGYCQRTESLSSSNESMSSDILSNSYQTSVDRLENHVMFFTELFDGGGQNLATWFSKAGQETNECVSTRIRSHVPRKRLTQQQMNEIDDVCGWLVSHKHGVSAVQRATVRGKIDKYSRLWGDVFLVELYDLATWLFDCARDALGIGIATRQSMREQLAMFPFDAVADQIRSPHVKRALLGLRDTGSFAQMQGLWQLLGLCADGTMVADLLEYAHVIYALYHFCSWLCQSNGVEISGTKNILFNLITIYDTINKLRIEDTLDSIVRFVNGFNNAFNQLQELELGFTGWLKGKWSVIPLAVGVVVVKIAQYFSASGSGSSFLPQYWNRDDSLVDNV